VRLGFAVAAQMEPDVLIIDEVLAVGDMGFVLKCFKRIDEILPKSAIIFVSHNMPMVSRICTKIILLEKGSASMSGYQVSQAIDMYYSRFTSTTKTEVISDGSINLLDLIILNKNNASTSKEVHWRKTLKMRLDFDIKNQKGLVFTIIIFDKEQRPLAVLEKFKTSPESIVLNSKFSLFVEHQDLQMSKGVYFVSVVVSEAKSNSPIYRVNNAGSFQVVHDLQVWQPFLLNAKYKFQ
jgi:lipopolysaccharide transport system ATP-binding protein